jgi:hypothetical protein
VGWIGLHSLGRSGAPVAAQEFSSGASGVVVPMGGGVAGYLGRHGVVDGRVSYDLVANANSFTAFGARPDMWTASVNGGYAF